VLHGGALERGWLASAQAIGGLAGGLAIGWIARRMRPMPLIAISGAILGVACLAFANIGAFPIDPELRLPLALALKTLQGPPIIGFFVSLEVLLQQSVPDRYRGRIFGAYGAASALAMLIGQLAASLLGERVGIVPVYSGVGYMFLAAGGLALLLLGSRSGARSASSQDGDQPGSAAIRKSVPAFDDGR